MSGPIVRTGTNPEFWENWERAFGSGDAKGKKKAGAKAARKKAAKKKAAKKKAGKKKAAKKKKSK